MTPDEIRAIAERLVQLRKMSLGPYDIDVDPVRDYGAPAAVSSALLAALPVVEAAQTVTRKAIVILDFHEQGTTVELDLMRDALAAFDKTIAEIGP